MTVCETLNEEDYIRPFPDMNYGSIRDLHVHVADCYAYWLGVIGMNHAETRYEGTNYVKVADVRHLFAEIDTLVDRFIARYHSDWLQTVSGKVWFQLDPFTVNVLWLFTHTTTHEFHHKGQIVTLARRLGYVPPDTDLIVPAFH